MASASVIAASSSVRSAPLQNRTSNSGPSASIVAGRRTGAFPLPCAAAAATTRIEKSSDYPAFDSSAVNGAHDLSFEPARQGIDSVGAWVLLPVQFDLPGSDSAAVR